MKKRSKSDILKKEVINALTASIGVVTTACKKTGVPRSTFYDWYNGDEEFKKSVDEIGEEAIDFVESKLFERINGVWIDTGKTDDDDEPLTYKQPPSDTAMIFYLKTKAKHRGYIEKSQLEHSGGIDTGIDGKTLDELKEMQREAVKEALKQNPDILKG